MNQKTKAATKYRPVLTSVQIIKILALAKTEIPYLTEESISLIGTLAPFLAKIENEGITAAYTMAPPRVARDSLEALGFTASVDVDLSKEEYWELCYKKHAISPKDCSLQEINAAQEHRYLNGLMTAEEAIRFEEHGA